MTTAVTNSRKRLLEYDALHRRLWIGGQRMHHGAGGLLVATIACWGLLTGHRRRSVDELLAWALAGGALMVHDWKDRSQWFALGHGGEL
jgi:hypothetical protein